MKSVFTSRHGLVLLLFIPLVIFAGGCHRKYKRGGGGGGGSGSAPPGMTAGRVVLQEIRGQVEYRAPGTGIWQKASVGMDLYPGAELRTGGGSSAKLSFPSNGSVVVLRQFSMIFFNTMHASILDGGATVSARIFVVQGEIAATFVSQATPSQFEIWALESNPLSFRPAAFQTMSTSVKVYVDIPSSSPPPIWWPEYNLTIFMVDSADGYHGIYPLDPRNIPEPSSLSLLIFACLSWLGWKWAARWNAGRNRSTN
ncbi:MAG: hypothetical protein AB1813_00890 [Verrucomicrobiota bacterium]